MYRLVLITIIFLETQSRGKQVKGNSALVIPLVSIAYG